MNDIEKSIRIYDIPENRKTCFNNENMTMSIMEKAVTAYVEKMDDFICESIIKCLPDDVTKVLFLDKNKITEIFRKQLSDGWIPVSERLPEKSDIYLATFTENGKNYVERFYYSVINGWMMPVSWQDEGHIDKFVAWQPLPEEYKEVEND